MGAMRQLTQPGPRADARVVSAVGLVRTLDFTLAPGQTLNAAVAGPLLEAGFSSAQVEISGGAFGPFTYVMPAGAQDAAHAAWYSAAFSPPGECPIEAGNITFGRKESAPFLHCHAFWQEGDGTRHGGHVLPHETVVAAPIRARAFGTGDVNTTADFDPETNFTLFTPHQARAPEADGRRIAFARVRPNADIFAALETLARQHGFAAGRMRGGVGSLIGARFADRGPVEDYATEVFVRDGIVVPGGPGSLATRLDVALVGMTGVLAEGRLVRGENAVCITFEVALEEAEPSELA